MSIVCLGLNHQSAPLDVLEKVSFSKPEMVDFLGGLRGENIFQEIAGLSTCNRTEFYFVTPEASLGRQALLRRLLDRKCADSSLSAGEHTYTHRNDRAARHLFRVAAGVDSLIVGEAQILGQIRQAYETAMDVGSVGGMLNSLMMRAISFGRKVRTRTNIGKGNVSVASVAVKVALEVFPDLGSRSLLVIGAGETAQLAARHFRKSGIGTVLVCNRTEENARAFVEEVAGQFFPIERMQTALEDSDIVVCAAGAPHYIITPGGLEFIMGRRNGRPLLLVDLSLPRNVDPETAKLPNVKLRTLEHLEAIASDNRDQRVSEIHQVESLIEKETANFIRWTQSAETGRLVVSLRRRIEGIRQQHMARHGRSLPEEEREQLSRYTDSLLRSIFHDVTVNIRSMDLETEDGKRQFDLVCRLFNVDPKDTEE